MPSPYTLKFSPQPNTIIRLPECLFCLGLCYHCHLLYREQVRCREMLVLAMVCANERDLLRDAKASLAVSCYEYESYRMANKTCL